MELVQSHELVSIYRLSCWHCIKKSDERQGIIFFVSFGRHLLQFTSTGERLQTGISHSWYFRCGRTTA